MAVSVKLSLNKPPPAETFTRQMRSIGLRFAAQNTASADIEQTIILASIEGMGGDFRVLSVLTAWLGVHAGYINIDKLHRLLKTINDKRVIAYWRAIGQWQSKDKRFLKIVKLPSTKRIDVLPIGTDFLIKRNGEDIRFVNTAIRTPTKALRDRIADVLPPEMLAAKHAGYRNRVKMGPSWRADVWTQLELDPKISTAEAARRAGCSYAAAWAVHRDFRLLNS
ncbi:MAG: hypothetical protein L3J82_03565 [Planctomycetes bacterium]|nr:hypothetical protein [Planctomycetota bacterium]